MKCSLWSAILCYASLIAGEYLQHNLFSSALMERSFDKQLKLPKRQLAYSDALTRLRLFRRASPPPRRQSPQRQRVDSAAHTNVQAAAHGPARILVAQNPAPGTVQNSREEHVPQGQHQTSQTSHNVASFASAQARDFSPLGDAQHPATEYPAKSSSQGRKAIGIVTTPVGGRGHVKLEHSGQVETYDIPGGRTEVKSITSHLPGGAKAEASVTRGGNTYAAGSAMPGPL